MSSDPSKDIYSYNRMAWDRQVADGNQWTLPVSSEEIEQARNGQCKIVLTPSKLVPQEWLMPLKGKEVLCLAGGGGQQAPLLAAAGAIVSVLDNSPSQLEQDQKVAEREGLEVNTVLGVMTDLSAFEDNRFDLIVHPCSNCFTPDVLPVWKEAYRVTKPGGHLISGFTNPLFYIFDYEEFEKKNLVVKHKIPYSDIESLSEPMKQKLIEEGEPFTYGHSLQDLMGGQIDAGYAITGFYEDNWEQEEQLLSPLIDCFIATRATKGSA